MKKIFRVFGFLLVISLVSQPFIVCALSIPSSGEIMDDIEKRYGFDSNSLRRSQKKANYPEVSIFFNKKEPKEGEKITATASALNFKTSNEDLFYTWFLIREEDNPDDDDVMEKAKRRATGVVARGDFDPFLFNVDYSDGDSDPDDDAYTAPFGGATGRGGKPGDGYSGIGHFEEYCYSDKARRVVDHSCITRCYKHNFGINNPTGNDNYDTSKAGRDLIVECEHQFPEAPEGDSFENPANGEEITCEDDYEIGDGEFTTNEEACWRLNPNSSDTDGDGFRDEEDLAGLGQQQFTWNYKKGDRVGVIVEGTSMVPTNEGSNRDASYTSETQSIDGKYIDGFDVDQNHTQTQSVDSTGNNPYYKITWAGIDVCTDEKNENGDSMDDFFANDQCDNESRDLGYTYLATRPVYEKQEGTLNIELDYDPASPQADLDNELYNSRISINSGIDEENIKEDFIYYNWDIYYCGDGDLEKCTENAQSGEGGAELLTQGCVQNDVLGECAEDVFDSNSYIEGMGLKDINFKLKKSFLNAKGVEDGDKFYLKAFLRAKKNKNSDIVSVAGADIPVVVNNTKIDLYKASKRADGIYDEGEIICGSGLYGRLCPVYPFQMIIAKANLEEEYESYLWEINGKRVDAPLNSADCIFGNGCAMGDTLYLPVLGSDKSVVNISLKAEKEEGENVYTDRVLSVSDPVPIIKSEDESKLWPRVVDDGTEDGKVSQKVFFATIGKRAEARVDLVPSYLDYNDLNLTWYLNGLEVDEDFISKNEDLEVSLKGENGERINFNVLGDPGDSLHLKVEIRKEFKSEYVNDLNESWGVEDVKTLKNEKTILVRKTNNSNEEETAQKGTLSFFLASTYKNAPEYIIFLFRLSISIVLFWFILYGVLFLDKNKGEYKDLLKNDKNKIDD